MIIEPTTSQLMEKVPDKFELILTVAKRARELRGGKDRLTIFNHPNNLTVAAEEVKEGLVKPAYKKNIISY